MKTENVINFSNIIGLRKKEQNAQKVFFEQYAETLFKIVMRYVQNKEDAEDILVNTFLKIFEKVQNTSEFNDLEHFSNWAKRITVNESLQFLRKKVNFSSISEPVVSNDLSIEPDILNELSKNEINTYIAELPTGCRTVFNLFAIEGFSHSEISEKLKINEGTSKSQLNRARKLLTEKMKNIKDYDNRRI